MKPSNALLFSAALLAGLTAPSSAQPQEKLTIRGPRNTAVATAIDWSKATPLSGEIRSTEKGSFVRITHDGTEAKTLPIITIENPQVGERYRLLGTVRYEGIEGKAYLEMWSVLRARKTSEVGRYFSRTLADTGPMGVLTGSSDWREFALPFSAAGQDVDVVRLEIGLHMPSKGVVEIGPLTLNAMTDHPGAAGSWWTPSTGGALGGVFGSILGIAFLVLGVLMSRGRARTFVVTSLLVLALVGLVLLAAGGFAFVREQPYAVYYPLFLIGGLCTVLGLSLFGVAKRRYADVELRRMQAMDAG